MAKKSVVNRQAAESSRWPAIAPYAVLSLGSFLCALVLVGLLLWKAELLARLGLTGGFYYLVLLPLGLAVAGFLFGALRSFARYKGRHLGGVLELGGPVVGFALVVLGGFLLPPPTSNFPLTVYVHGESGPQEMVLRDQGSVLLDLGGERRSEPIGSNGQAFFPEIPASFRGQWVNVAIDADGYELADPARQYRLDGASLYLPVRKRPGHLGGSVQDEAGNPVPDATITVVGLSTKTDSSGHFDLAIPADRLRNEMQLQAVANGYAPWRGSVIPSIIPSGTEVTITLTSLP